MARAEVPVVTASTVTANIVTTYLNELSWVQVDRILEPFKGRYSPEETEGGRCQAKPRGDEVAFLQYTSGSTSEPKGVMISHSNLAHNESLIQAALQTDSLTVNVSWLPQYHDVILLICRLSHIVT